jgi:hypothetical protein
MTAEDLARRLITLIFAGRNRRDMIRRELPRTKHAGWVRKPFRIERKEGSPFSLVLRCHRCCCPERLHALSCLGEFVLRFGVDGDGPNEPEQFATQGRHNLILVLAAEGEHLVAFVKAILCFPCHLFDLVAEG